MTTFKIIGAMSGTSCDGIDVALLETDGINYVNLLGGSTFPYSEDVIANIKNLNQNSSYLQILHMEHLLTQLHAEAINQFMINQKIECTNIDYIGFHGQTIFHDPRQGITSQIGNPHLLSQLTKIKVINDFRRKDIAYGGWGAPLVPIFHQAINNHLKFGASVYLNIGGVANITYIDGENLIAFDTGPGNALLDDFMMKRTGSLYDQDGAVAKSGIVDQDVIQKFTTDPFLQIPSPKSLDRNHFQYISVDHLNLNDGAATLTYATAALIQSSLNLVPQPQRVLVCGGGRKNLHLLQHLQQLLPYNVDDIDTVGIDGDSVEAYAFAYLAARCALGLPISFPSTTGISNAMTGGSISI